MPSYVDEPRGWLPIPAYALIVASLLSVVLTAIVIRQSGDPPAVQQTETSVTGAPVP